jgi:hypothetical protein
MMNTKLEKDRDILRRLADQQANIAALPVHRSTSLAWDHLNRLVKDRPMVWINEIPWHEMEFNDELTLQTSDGFCRGVEQELRRTIYQWNHMRCDMVVEPKFYCPLVIRDTGLGIIDKKLTCITDRTSDIVSQHFIPQIQSEADISKIQLPEVTLDGEQTDANYQRLVDLFGDLITIEKCGVQDFWFAPWDLLVTWWGVQEALTDLIDRPELVKLAMERILTAFLYRLDQYEQLDLLSLNNTNVRVGSGGLGYVGDLPAAGFEPAHVRTSDLWGSSAAQIFGSVSPVMHETFSLQYERRWLERFGLSYYGCCEPLHKKLDILKSIPNLRKISMSPWANLDDAVDNVGDRYVLSIKPNPAIFASEHWDLESSRQSLRQSMEKTRGCVKEIIMKDISTVRYEPQRLWEWSRMAMEVVTGEKYS